jgi:hypothetical protein
VADHTYEVGDRFEDLDWRNEGRVIELREVVQDGKFRAQTEAHPKNPSAVGRHVTISPKSLDKRYRKISR